MSDQIEVPSDPGLGGLESSVTATLSIDTDTVEQVHERLIRKGNQNALRASVIDEMRGVIDAIPVNDAADAASSLTTADRFKLGLILNRDCDTV